jgi:hypothetical protein
MLEMNWVAMAHLPKIMGEPRSLSFNYPHNSLGEIMQNPEDGPPEIVDDAHQTLREDLNKQNLAEEVNPRAIPANAARALANLPELPPEATVSLMTAMGNYITAQVMYMHDKDLTAFVKAQEAFINAQGYYVSLLDMRLFAETQEQIIGIQMRALRKSGQM